MTALPPTALKAPLARLDDEREQLAKAWLVRVIERASLDEIQGLPTDRIARELPAVIADLLRIVGSERDDASDLDADEAERAGALARLRGGETQSVAELTRDLAALQSILVSALGRELSGAEPEALVMAVERFASAIGAVQAVALEELVQARSRELESLANTDALTGLYNRRYLRQHIEHLLDVHKRYDHPFAVLVLDVDGLKRVNDSYGHAAGDRLLTTAAAAIRQTVRSVDTPARTGGDEFCVLAPHQALNAGLILGRRLAAAVGEAATPDAPSIGVSVGVASCPEHGTAAEQLLEVADRAMYRAKSSGEVVTVGVPDSGQLAEAEPHS